MDKKDMKILVGIFGGLAAVIACGSIWDAYERHQWMRRCSQEMEEDCGRIMGVQQMSGSGMYVPNEMRQPKANPYSPRMMGGEGRRTIGMGKDNSAEIQMLELRLVDLRRQLEEAKHDSRMSALQGIGTLTTSMRVQTVMRQIQEVQGRLLQLQ